MQMTNHHNKLSSIQWMILLVTTEQHNLPIGGTPLSRQPHNYRVYLQRGQ